MKAEVKGFELKKYPAWHNPLKVNGKEISVIIFFKDGEEVAKFRWFTVEELTRKDGTTTLFEGSNSALVDSVYIPIPLVGENKRKIDLTSKTAFMVSVPREYWDKSKTAYRDLYIPLDSLNYEIKEDWKEYEYTQTRMFFNMIWFPDFKLGGVYKNREEPIKENRDFLKETAQLVDLMAINGRINESHMVNNMDQIQAEIKRLSGVDLEQLARIHMQYYNGEINAPYALNQYRVAIGLTDAKIREFVEVTE